MWKEVSVSELQGKLYLKAVANQVADLYQIQVDEMLSDSRKRYLVAPRWNFWYLVYKTGRFSLHQIGDFSSRDHSTIHHGLKKWKEHERQCEAAWKRLNTKVLH